MTWEVLCKCSGNVLIGYTNLAIFGFFLSNKHDSFGFRKFCLKVKEKITKIENNDKYFFFYFLHISQKP